MVTAILDTNVFIRAVLRPKSWSAKLIFPALMLADKSSDVIPAIDGGRPK